VTAYSKAIAAAIGAAATWAATYFPNAAWVGVLTAIAAVATVYFAPKNTPAEASDSGESFVGFVYVVALFAVIVAAAVYVYHHVG
jgi:hypothetical protein